MRIRGDGSVRKRRADQKSDYIAAPQRTNQPEPTFCSQYSREQEQVIPHRMRCPE
jgi:hypothetical protein